MVQTTTGLRPIVSDHNRWPEEKMQPTPPTQTIEFTRENIRMFPVYEKMVIDGKARFDGKGRLRYAHGAPVGKMILARVNKDGAPIYKEVASEWFDPDSPKATAFIWP